MRHPVCTLQANDFNKVALYTLSFVILIMIWKNEHAYKKNIESIWKQFMDSQRKKCQKNVDQMNGVKMLFQWCVGSASGDTKHGASTILQSSETQIFLPDDKLWWQIWFDLEQTIPHSHWYNHHNYIQI